MRFQLEPVLIRARASLFARGPGQREWWHESDRRGGTVAGLDAGRAL